MTNKNCLLNRFRPGHEAIYGFSEFTCSLNEPEEGVAPTDSRLRPDQRFMEQGNFDEANKIKVCKPQLMMNRHLKGSEPE